MPALVTTLNARLEAADALHDQGRHAAALSAYEDLVAAAQDRADRTVEILARSMAARCLLHRRDLDGAREHLAAIQALPATLHLDAQARYQAALARVGLAEGPDLQPLHAYLAWAEEQAHPAAEADACGLLAERATGEDRATWLQRALEAAERAGLEPRMGALCTDLGATLDLLDRPDEALSAYGRALEHHRKHGSQRQVIGAAWAVGSAATRTEDYALARERLEEAVTLAEATDDAGDLLALALADLAAVNEAAGDVVEARRLLLRAGKLGRAQDLPSLWPERWRTLVEQGRGLDIEV